MDLTPGRDKSRKRFTQYTADYLAPDEMLVSSKRLHDATCNQYRKNINSAPIKCRLKWPSKKDDSSF
jgi:hypothetical protein